MTDEQTATDEAAPNREPFFRHLISSIPEFLVLGFFGAVLWWGNKTHWKIPTFAELTQTQHDAVEPWCDEHHIDLANCVACNADLMPRAVQPGWDSELGVHLSVMKHPQFAEMGKTPDPSAFAADLARARRALALLPRKRNAKNCQMNQRRIQFTTKKDAEKIGVQFEPVWRARMEEFVSGPGEIVYDDTRVARISTRSRGIAHKVYKQQGDAVTKGELLALIDAAQVGQARSDFIGALVQERLQAQMLARLTRAASEGGLARRDLAEAEQEASKARIQLARAQQALANLGLVVDPSTLGKLSEEQLASEMPWLGLPAGLVDALKGETSSANLLPVHAPFTGVLTDCSVVAGELISPDRHMFVLADPSQLWLHLNLGLEDTRLIKVGYEVRLKPDAGEEIIGKIAWIAPEADKVTRTVRLRAVVPNPDRTIVAHTFGTGRVMLRVEPKAVVVPIEAVQWEGCCTLVFVQEKSWFKKGSFKVVHARSVRIGARNAQHAEILAGVLPGEMIVVGGAAAMKSELLRSNLGAG